MRIKFCFMIMLMVGLMASVQACRSGAVRVTPARIAFLHHSDEKVLVYTVLDNGQNLKQVTALHLHNPAGQGLDYIPVSMNPTGKYLAWIDYITGPMYPGILYVANLDTEETYTVTLQATGDPIDQILQWSPDGTMLTFCEASEEQDNIATFRVLFTKTMQEKELDAEISKPLCGAQSWSFDSKYLAIVNGTEIMTYQMPEGQQIWKSNLSNALPGTTSLLCNLSWSSDSSKLAFATGCAEGRSPFFQEDWHEVYIVSPNNDSITQATEIMRVEDIGLSYAQMEPIWSVNGDLVTIFSYKPSFSNPTKDEIDGRDGFVEYDISTDMIKQRNEVVFLPIATYRERVVRSSSGDIVWHSIRGWEFAEFTNSFNYIGPANFNIPAGCWPVWQPTGAKFAFTSSDDVSNCSGDDRDVYVVTLETEEVVNITDSLGGDNLLLGWYSE
jgi:Tol biopolymer transport system component